VPGALKKYHHILFDWGDTLMENIEGYEGPMYLWPEIQVIEGAHEILEFFSSHSKCHLATNAKDSSEEEIWLALKRAGLDLFINTIFCFQKTGLKKPSNAYFIHIIESLGGDPAQILMIGDSLDGDIFGAERAGMSGIWFNRKNAVVPDKVKAVHSLGELKTI